jgi:hypothetical protein
MSGTSLNRFTIHLILLRREVNEINLLFILHLVLNIIIILLYTADAPLRCYFITQKPSNAAPNLFIGKIAVLFCSFVYIYIYMYIISIQSLLLYNMIA